MRRTSWGASGIVSASDFVGASETVYASTASVHRRRDHIEFVGPRRVVVRALARRALARQVVVGEWPNSRTAVRASACIRDGRASGGRPGFGSRLAHGWQASVGESYTQHVFRAGAAVIRRPMLWPTAVRQMRRTAPPGWWKQRPFLPVPSGEYLRFRLLTQYGDARHAWEPNDVIRYLDWCKSWERPS